MPKLSEKSLIEKIVVIGKAYTAKLPHLLQNMVFKE